MNAAPIPVCHLCRQIVQIGEILFKAVDVHQRQILLSPGRAPMPPLIHDVHLISGLKEIIYHLNVFLGGFREPMNHCDDAFCILPPVAFIIDFILTIIRTEEAAVSVFF